MKALANAEPSISRFSSIPSTKLSYPIHSFTSTSLSFTPTSSRRWIRRNLSLKARASLSSATLDQLGFSDSGSRNPAVSTSYRSSNLPKPNQTVLEAQARVCTGPTQTKPLGEDQAFKVLDTILRSGEFFFTFSIGFSIMVCIRCM